MLKKLKKIFFIGLIILFFMPSAYSKNINSVIIYAVDVSGSYRNIYHQKLKMEQKVEKNAFKFLNKLVSALETDVSFKAIAITDLSSLGNVLCEVRISRKSFFKPAKKLQGINKDQFYVRKVFFFEISLSFFIF